MANSKSDVGTITLDTAGGYGGPLTAHTLIFTSATNTGTFSLRAGNSATAPVLLTMLVNKDLKPVEVVPFNRTLASGIYLNTGFPAGGTVQLVQK